MRLKRRYFLIWLAGCCLWAGFLAVMSLCAPPVSQAARDGFAAGMANRPALGLVWVGILLLAPPIFLWVGLYLVQSHRHCRHGMSVPPRDWTPRDGTP